MDNKYTLTRDGEVILENVPYFSAMAYIHTMHSYSLDWAIKFEGYRLEEVGNE